MSAPHILAVDDDPAIRQLIAEYLTENGFRVSIAADAKAMRQRLTQSPVDLVVLDIRLGQEDGMVLARELRATSEVPIVMLTGQREEADRVMGLELGQTITSPSPSARASCSPASGPCCAGPEAASQPRLNATSEPCIDSPAGSSTCAPAVCARRRARPSP